MGQTLTSLKKAIKNDTLENVIIGEINDAFDKFDNNFIPAAKMHFIGSQTLTHNVSTTQDFDTVTFDTFAARSEGAMADLALNRIVIRKAGVYSIKASNGFASNSSGLRRTSLAVNGTPIAHIEGPPAVGGVTSLFIGTDEVLAVNDVITVGTIQTSGGNLDVSNGLFTKAIYLSVVWQGAAVEV